MKIIHEDSGLLVLKQGYIFLYIVGAVFLVLGIIGFVRPDIFSEAPNNFVSAIGVLGGVFIFFFVKRETIYLDKSVLQMRVLRASLLSKKEEIFDLRTIVNIACGEVVSRPNNGTASKETKLVFLFKDGKEFIASGGIHSGFKAGLLLRAFVTSPQAPEVADRVSKFLDVPFIDQRNPSTSEIFSAISKTVSQTVTDAIAEREKKDENKTI